jgi:O-antigen/teichoic acid export membrane protein
MKQDSKKTMHDSVSGVDGTGPGCAEFGIVGYLKLKYRRLLADKGFFEILHGTAWAMVSRVGAMAMSLISSVLITRLYGAESMGILALVTSVLGIATVFTVMGTSTAILRLIPEHLSKYSPASAFCVYRKTQYLVVGVSVIAGLFLYVLSSRIAGSVFNKPHLSGLISVAAAFIGFKSLMLLNQQAVRGLKLIRIYSFLQLLPSLALLILLLIGLFWKTPNTPAYAQMLAWALTGIIGVIIMDRAFRCRMHPNDTICSMPVRNILALSTPMFMTASMDIVISQTGIVILGMHRPAEEVGYYAVAVRLATLTIFVFKAINTMCAPKFSELYYKQEMDELFRIARKSTQLIFFATAPILLCLSFFGKQILSCFGPTFPAAYPAMMLLVIGQFFSSIAGSTSQFMNMTGRQIAFQNIIATAAVINLLVNLAITPKLGILGAATAASLSTVFWNIAVLVYIKRMYGRTIHFDPFRAILLIKQGKDKS